ncbi:MAG TPA: ferrous iron transport protein B [Bacteroidales bacterium]|nr:ferrous iron transport protein B [Bacteroidales bacterium]
MDKKSLVLSDMPEGSSCTIIKVHGYGGFRHRILEMGFVRGERIDVIKNAPLTDPIEYRIMGSHVSLRRNEAKNIEVVSLSADAHNDIETPQTFEEHLETEIRELTHDITVALVGNPNCGKTSFFNHATGLREKVGNYSGVTVDAKVGIYHHRGYTINLIDLPGTYSLTDYTPEERYVRQYITEQKPDIVLNIIDAGNLERNMLLTTQLIDQSLPLVMALNMYDELERSGDKIDIAAMQQMLGFPIIPTVSSTGKGINDVLEAIVNIYEHQEADTKHIHINYGPDIEDAIRQVKTHIDKNEQLKAIYHSRYLAIEALQNDSITMNLLNTMPNIGDIQQVASEQRKKLEQEFQNDIQTIITDAKYGFIRGALHEVLTHNSTQDRLRLGYALDTILTNRWLGFPILILFLWLMFETTFTLGAYPQQWLEQAVAWLGKQIEQLMAPGMLRDLIVEGVIAGVGGVLVFLPNILILFFFISLLEDTGYMARAAFIMDKLMHRIGLHGKSFIPYLIGFGCGVPAIMATRTLQNPKDRILTIITIPFMSCSARLPVYMLLIPMFFANHKAIILLSLYLLGIAVAIITSIIVKRFAFKDADDQFVMELPPYRFPTVRNTMIHMWDKSVQYLQKMGTIILFASIIIWALGYFPRPLPEMTEAEAAQHSYIGMLGHTLAPVFKPLGMQWQMGVSLITGIAAKEVVVSSLSVLYPDTMPFTPLTALAFMVFILLYFPCIAAVTAIRREAGRKWMWFTIIYTTLLAWFCAMLVYQIGNMII